MTGIVLQSRVRQAYLNVRDEWSERVEDARRFNSAKEAADFCNAGNLPEAVIVIFRDNQPPLRVSISTRRPDDLQRLDPSP